MTSRNHSLTSTRLFILLVAVAILLTSCRPAPDASGDPPATDQPGQGQARSQSRPSESSGPGSIVQALRLDGMPGVLGWRVLYHSTARDGRDIVVSGLVFAPEQPADRPRPVLAWGHGSVGLGDSCAPSRSPGSLVSQPLFRDILSRGFVVAATDYEGLGTGGSHPWLVGLSEGRGVIDSVRAAQQIAETGAGNRFVAFGASQGGGAVLFAGELTESYGEGLELLGVVSAAPAAELDLAGLTPDADIAGLSEFVVMGAFGFKAAYPDLDLNAILQPDIISQRERVERLCQGEIGSRFREMPVREVLKSAPAGVPGWSQAIAENTPGSNRTRAPVLLLHGSADQVVPAEVSRRLLDRLCGIGTPAQRRVYRGVDHFGVLQAGAGDVLEFLDDRVAGRPTAAASCS